MQCEGEGCAYPAWTQDDCKISGKVRRYFLMIPHTLIDPLHTVHLPPKVLRLVVVGASNPPRRWCASSYVMWCGTDTCYSSDLLLWTTRLRKGRSQIRRRRPSGRRSRSARLSTLRKSSSVVVYHPPLMSHYEDRLRCLKRKMSL